MSSLERRLEQLERRAAADEGDEPSVIIITHEARSPPPEAAVEAIKGGWLGTWQGPDGRVGWL